MPTGSKDVMALYHPAINQVWISGPDFEEELSLIHAHEGMHVYTTSLQPSQLLLLRAELIGSIDRPGTDCFDEIVETVCEACFWAQTKLGIEDIPHMIQDAKYPATFSALMDLGQKIASNAPEQSIQEQTLKEAVVGVCILLMHIIPQRPHLGLELVRIIAGLPLQEGHVDRWRVFHNLYMKLNSEWQKTNEFKKLFALALPRDSHRFVSDMVIFLLGALNVINHKPRVITAVFPVLLSLLTQASFVLLPYIYIKELKRGYKAEIKIIHSTSKSNKAPCEAALLQKDALTKSKREGISCGAGHVFVSLINESNKYRISNAKDRTYKCFDELLGHLPDLLRTYVLAKNNCPGCCSIFRGGIFQSATDAIINLSKNTRQQIMQSVKKYDEFLVTDTMDIVGDAWNLNSKPQAFRCYDFL